MARNIPESQEPNPRGALSPGAVVLPAVQSHRYATRAPPIVAHPRAERAHSLRARLRARRATLHGCALKIFDRVCAA